MVLCPPMIGSEKKILRNALIRLLSACGYAHHARNGKVQPSTLIIDGASTGSAPYSVNSSAMTELTNSLKSLMDGDGEIQINLLDEKLVKFLAMQRIQEIFSSKDHPVASATRPPPTPSLGHHVEDQRSLVLSDTVRYLKVSVSDSIGRYPKNIGYRRYRYPIPIQVNGTSSIGRSRDVIRIPHSQNSFVLILGIDRTRRMSRASFSFTKLLILIENTKHYELLNYSEHGTTVDNVLYSCDFSEKILPTPPSSIVAKVQNVIKCRKSQNPEPEPVKEEAVMNSHAQGPHVQPCNCKASSSSLIGGSGAGWEGTALLHHGSYIKLGCIQFLFSITEFATRQPKGESEALAQDLDLEDKISLKSPHQVPVLRSNSVP
ncbi:unnamed protein product [Ranitomeya imitator]|uniref:Uncharacterized protein n=1 Tax=Ranitomeya imitator TaxID=111125 RepID=A0ABN9MIN3_9NEOB|nr:unnamed protein product [Ranitomeya imitator]